MGEEANKEPVESAPRKSRAWIWWLMLLVCVLAVLGSAVALVFGWHEPKYSDKPLSYWLAELNGTNYIRRDIAADALAKIGEPALEPLKFALRKERSFVYELRDRVWKIAPPAIQQHIPKPWNVDDLQYNACVGIAAMGPQAAALVPDLIQVLTNKTPAIQSRATFAMRQIGSNAYPALLTASTSTNLTLANMSQSFLAQINFQVPMSDAVKTKLRTVLQSETLKTGEISLFLTQLKLSNVEAVNLLTPELAATNEITRMRAAILLGHLDQRSEAITHLLLAGLTNDVIADKFPVVTGLMNQRAFIRPYREQLEKLVPQQVPYFSNSFSQSMEGLFGLSEEKWRTLEHNIATGDQFQQQLALSQIQTSVYRRNDMERCVAGLRTLLTSTNDPVVLQVLSVSIFTGRQLLPELEQLCERLKTRPETDALRVRAEQTLMSMKGQSSSSLPIRQPLPPRPLIQRPQPPSIPLPPPLPPTPQSFVVPAMTNQSTPSTRQIPQRPQRISPITPSVP